MPPASNKIFTETQKHDALWFKCFAIALSALSITGTTWYLAAPLHSVPDIVGIVSFVGVFVALFIDLLAFFKSLYIKIDEQGILFKEKPSKTEILCRWEYIDRVLYRYNFLRIRSTAKNGMGYNLKGKTGIQIILKSGEKLQLGIQNIEEAKPVIEHYFKAEDFVESN